MKSIFHFLRENRERRISSEEISLACSSVDRNDVRNYVEMVLARPSDFPKSILYCARHQLGFDKFVIFESGGTFNRRIRIHFWESSESSHLDIHDHGYAFASTIVAGALEQRIFKEATVGDLYQKLSFLADGRACEPVNELQQFVSVDQTTTAVLRAGDVYYVNAADVHSVRPLVGPTVTIQLQDVVQPKMVSVYRPVSAVRDRSADFAQELTGQVAQERLQSLIALLAED